MTPFPSESGVGNFENEGPDDEGKVGNRGEGERRKCFIKCTELFRYNVSFKSFS